MSETETTTQSIEDEKIDLNIKIFWEPVTASGFDASTPGEMKKYSLDLQNEIKAAMFRLHMQTFHHESLQGNADGAPLLRVTRSDLTAMVANLTTISTILVP